MNKTFMGIPRIIIGFVLVIVAPIIFSVIYTSGKVVDRIVAMEQACVVKPTPEPILIEVTPQPTATPSPTIRPRIVTPKPATGGAN